MTLLMDTFPGWAAMMLGAAALMALLLAWRLGRAPERVLSSILCAAFALEWLWPGFVPSQSGPSAFRPDQAARDALLLASVGVVALRANRLYPLIMAGAALIAVLAHLLRGLDLFQGSYSYRMLITAPTYGMVATLWVGLALHVRREKLLGPYPAWCDKTSPQTIAATAKIG